MSTLNIHFHNKIRKCLLNTHKHVFLSYRKKKSITKTGLYKYNENFTTNEKKNENFQIKNSDNFHTSTQNIDCGCLLEPPP